MERSEIGGCAECWMPVFQDDIGEGAGTDDDGNVYCADCNGTYNPTSDFYEGDETMLEFCPVCGQPDNCGECTHEPMGEGR